MHRATFVSSSPLLLAILLGCFQLESPAVSAFQQQQKTTPSLLLKFRPRRQHSSNPLQLNLNDDDDDKLESLLLETSFGSEAVPEGQRPINEYLQVIRAPLFGWAALETPGLLTRLGLVYAVVFVAVCFPIAGATFTENGYLLQKVTSSNIGALGLVLVLLLRLYSGWGYVGSRLTCKVVEYEETGWYDGDFQPKTKNEYTRDMFLYNSKVKPVVERLKIVTLSAAGLWVASCVAFDAAMAQQQPHFFNQYDQDMLSQLQANDKLAERAAASQRGSAGRRPRPTYCDSRYYRAVAGGGQGCND